MSLGACIFIAFVEFVDCACSFFLVDDYSQYEPSAPFVSHAHVSQATLAALVAAGDLHFTLVIPPGVCRVAAALAARLSAPPAPPPVQEPV